MIKKMKKLCTTSLILLTLFLVGCASSSNSAAENEKKSAPSYSKSEKITARFDDWKYKGFGMSLPEWVEAAVDGKTEKVAKILNTKSEEIIIFTGSGINVDQSEDKLKVQIPQDKKLLEAFWVRVNEEVKKLEEPYITVLIYENKSALSQNQAQEDIE